MSDLSISEKQESWNTPTDSNVRTLKAVPSFAWNMGVLDETLILATLLALLPFSFFFFFSFFSFFSSFSCSTFLPELLLSGSDTGASFFVGEARPASNH
jgi:hypothetical protein